MESNSDNDDKRQIKTFKKVYPQIYAYRFDDDRMRDHDGWQKIGYTERENVDSRIVEQVRTAGVNMNYKKLWHASTVSRTDHTKYFTDHEFHNYLVQNSIPRSKPQSQNGFGDEWFYFDGTPEKSKILFDEYYGNDLFRNARTGKAPYKLREEQQRAVHDTLEYAAEHQTTDFNNPNDDAKYLWNAKPRFGKTLCAYDFAERFGARNVLVVTNRPAIANSWFEDFQKFIADDHHYFISTADSLKDQPSLTREQYLNRASQSSGDHQITFLSLQDLKGGKIFGGTHNKLEWVADLNWDLLVIDEAHEGVATERTDVAFQHIKRRFTLHLSGTPFKAIADGYFTTEQIFNWTYIDEQKAKQAEIESDNDSGDRLNLPDMRLFTYKMSDMIESQLSEGTEISDTNVDYAFDLNEMFSTDQSGRFIHEKEIKTFLYQLTHNEKYPFSTPELRAELKHTFWLVGNRVASAKAMEKLLHNDPTFEKYKIVIAAGDGKPNRDETDDDTSEEEMQDYAANEKAYDRVMDAIDNNEYTITLSVGQLTTGVTIKEWSAVLMLSDIKSESLYMQAIFRSQNPYKYTDQDGHVYRKKSAYVFDFSPNRVLQVYDKFANSLSATAAQGEITEAERKANVSDLLNYFPVLAEDDSGRMVELDAERVLTFPKAIIAKEIVKRGFVTNLLFVNINNVFNIPSEIVHTLDKASSTNDTGRPTKNDSIDHDPQRRENMKKRISVNKERLLGNKIYGQKMQDVVSAAVAEEPDDKKELIGKIVEGYADEVEEPLAVYKATYSPSKTEFEELKKDHIEKVKEVAQEYVDKDLTDYSTQKELASKLSDLIENDLPNDTVVREEEDAYQQEESSEMDQIRKKLRTFTRAIPSFIMASKDPDSITLDNIETTVSEEDFEELVSENSDAPFTKADFNMIRGPWTNPETGKKFEGFFDRYTFNAAIREFEAKRRELADYLQPGVKEDIFSYIRPLKTNQIFTPRRVVNMMLNELEEENPHIFKNPDTTFCDLYVKSGMYLTEIAKRLNRGLENIIPDRNERIKHILEKQLFGFAPTEIIYNITHKYIYGLYKDIDDSNLVQKDLSPLYERGEKLNMRFDVIIGNPPYQLNDNGKRAAGAGANASASPLYHKFIDLARSSAPKYLCMVVPSRWMVSGKGLGEFRKDLLSDHRMKVLHDYPNPKDVFPNVDIKGGICYFLWDSQYDGKCKYYVHSADGDLSMEKYLDEDGEVVIRYPELSSIKKKVWHHPSLVDATDDREDVHRLSSIVSVGRPYGLRTDTMYNPSKYGLPPMFNTAVEATKDGKKPLEIFGLVKNKRVKKYLPYDYPITVGRDDIPKWKVFIPEAYGCGAIGEQIPSPILGSPILGSPIQVCTETFLRYGSYNTEFEARSALKYLKTKFFRCLVGIYKNTQHTTKRVYVDVPVQDFTPNSDIDWSKSIPEIDQQLYKKYGLSQEEINFIEEKVAPME